MDFDALIRDEQDGLMRRLARMLGGDAAAAEDVRQETFERAWRSLPRELDAVRRRAWLHRTAGNLAIDELRRRARRPLLPIDRAVGETDVVDAPEPDAAREALAQLSAHERFVLLLRFEGGLAHAEIAQLLEVSEEAARKRAARARDAFLAAYRAVRSDPTPLVLLLVRDESSAPYVGWLQHAGARVRLLSDAPSERELALADGLVLSGALRDLHSSLYGEAPRTLRGEPDLAQDSADLAVIRTALALDLPVVGVCRGHQLLNIASGGSLFQDVVADGAATASHEAGPHRIEISADSASHGLLGRSVEVNSEHHQAIRRLGGRLRIAATAADGLIESIERTDRGFALGVQWHPEADSGGPGDRVAEALVEAAVRRAA